MATNYLERFIMDLDQIGVTDVFLPFLLIFILVYAILQKTHILGQEKKKLNVMLSVIIGLLVVIPHVLGTYPHGWDVVQIINEAVPSVAFVLVAVVMLLILLGVFGGSATNLGKRLGGWITVLATVVILFIFGASAGWWSDWPAIENILGEDTVALVVILLVFGIVINFITGSEKDKPTEKGQFNKSFESVFNKE